MPGKKHYPQGSRWGAPAVRLVLEEIMRSFLNKTGLQYCLDLMILLFVAGSVFSIAVTQTALTLAALIWMIMMARRKQILIPKTDLDYYFLAFALVSLFSLLFHPAESAAINYFKRVSLISIVYLAAARLSRGKLLRRSLVTLCGVAAVVSVIGIWIYISGAGGLAGRLRLFHHYMTSGGILMIVILITFAFSLVKAPWKIKILSISLSALMILPLIFTFTRSAWLGTLAGMVLMCSLANRKMLIGIILIICCVALLAPPSIKKRAMSSFDPSHERNIERIYMWKAGKNIIRDNPIAGVGDIDLMEIYSEYRHPESRESHGHLHNNFIMFGVIWGIPGLLLFLALFIRILITEIQMFRSAGRGGWLTRGSALGAIGVFAGFQVVGLFEWNFGDAEIVMLFWLTVGISIAAGHAVPKGKIQAEADDP